MYEDADATLCAPAAHRRTEPVIAELVADATQSGRVRVRARGEFDMSNADLFHRVLIDLLRHGVRSVHLDVAEVGFMDVTAIEAVLVIQRTFAASGASLLMTNLSRPVARVVELAGLVPTLVQQRSAIVVS